jgi:hypothetical protein
VSEEELELLKKIEEHLDVIEWLLQRIWRCDDPPEEEE